MLCPAFQMTGAGGRRRGFTLFEVLLVIALIGVAASMFVVSVGAIGRTSPADELEAAFWRAMALGREKALVSRRPVELYLDTETPRFVIAASEIVGEVPIPSGAWPAETRWSVAFTQERASNDFVLVRGQLIERRPVETVRLFPDGTCQAFAVEFTVGDATKLVTIDPWTGAQMLGTDETKPGRRM